MVETKTLPDEEFVALIGRHERRVRAFVRTLVAAQPEAVDDLVQGTLIAAWRRISSFQYSATRPDEELVRWLCGIARIEVRSARRQWGADRLIFSDELVEELADRHLQRSSEIDDRHQALEECVEQLNERDRSVLAGKYEGGLSARQIAQLVNRTEVAVLNSLSRLRRRLRECVEIRVHRSGGCR